MGEFVYNKDITGKYKGGLTMGRGKHRTFRVDDETWDRFRGICERKDLTASQMIRGMIRDLIKSEGGLAGNKAPNKPTRRRGKRKGE